MPSVLCHYFHLIFELRGIVVVLNFHLVVVSGLIIWLNCRSESFKFFTLDSRPLIQRGGERLLLLTKDPWSRWNRESLRPCAIKIFRVHFQVS